jgi:hypothetical protein
MRLMGAGQGGHVTKAVKAGDESSCLQVPKTQFLVLAAADHPLTVRRNRNAQNNCSVTTWGSSRITTYECACEKHGRKAYGAYYIHLEVLGF